MPGGYGSRTPAQTLWLATAMVVVAVLLTVGGWLAFSGVGTQAPSPTPVSGDASTERAARGVAFGAPEVVAGVPWGFPLDRQGAASAAASAVAATGRPEVVFDPDRFAQVAAVIFDAGQARLQAERVAAARAQLEVSGWADQPASRRMYHLAPLAVRVVSFDPHGPAAQVEVWAMTLLGVGDAGGAVFTISTVDLAGDEQGGWRVVGLESVKGPVPVVEAGPSAPGRVRALVRGATAPLPLPLPAAGGRR